MLQISVLGGLQVSLDGKPVEGFISSKAEALLGYLALTGRAHTRDELAALLWGDSSNESAKTSLRQALHNLRKLIGDHLLIERDSVAFNSAKSHWVDALEFEHAATQDERRKTQDEPHDINHLSSCVNLYGGDFLQGVNVRDAPTFEEWVIAQRERYRLLALQALDQLVQHYASQGEYNRAIDYARRILALDNWREETHRQLMLYLVRSGQRSAALQQYEICRVVLRKELGIEPSRETSALYQRIRTAMTASGGNLAAHAPNTPLIGRAQELADIRQRLNNRHCRLLTLMGLGGSGKTRLALAAAEQAAKSFLNGAFFVPLTAVQSAESLPASIADALQYAFSGTAGPQAQLLDYLREKEVLLVLDNFEQLAEHERSAALIAAMLKAAPDVKLIVTSRRRLNLSSEWVYEVGGVSDRDATELFVQCAARVQTGFAPSEAERPCIARVCRLVSHLPLGIELIAAWTPVLSCAEIIAELQRSLNLLTTTMRDVPERHRSMRAVFDQSCSALSSVEQEMLRRLSVFRGSFDREAAQVVAGFGEPSAAIKVLSSLLDRSLIRRNASQRFDLHELLRQFAAEQLGDSAEREVVSGRHCAHYAWLVKCWELHLMTERHRDADNAIRSDLENIRAAWEWAACHSRWEKVEAMAHGLYRFCDSAGRHREGVDLMAQAVAAIESSIGQIKQGVDHQLTVLLGNLLARQACLTQQLGQADGARALAQRALVALNATRAMDVTSDHSVETELGKALSQSALGLVCWMKGEYRDAHEHFAIGLKHAEACGDQRLAAQLLDELGRMTRELGDFEQARVLHERSIHLQRELGNKHGAAWAIESLSIVFKLEGLHEECIRLQQEALALFKEVGDEYNVCRVLNNLGVSFIDNKQLPEAEHHLYESLAVSRHLGHRFLIGVALGNLGEVCALTHRFEDAYANLREALDVMQALNAMPFLMSALNWYAILWAEEGRAVEALEMLSFMYHADAISMKKETRERVRQLRERLMAQLPASVVAEVEARGRAKSLEDAIAEVRSQPRAG